MHPSIHSFVHPTLYLFLIPSTVWQYCVHPLFKPFILSSSQSPLHLSIYLPLHPSINRAFYCFGNTLFIHPPIHQSTALPILYPSIRLSIHPQVHFSGNTALIHSSISLFGCHSIHLSILPSHDPSVSSLLCQYCIHPFISLFISHSYHRSNHRSIHSSINLFSYVSFHPSILQLNLRSN